MSKRSQHKEMPERGRTDVSLPIKMGIRMLAFTHFVCPLLFFTNLTRNPYYTQIALLNMAIALCGILWAVDVWKKKEWTLPRTPFEWPVLCFVLFSMIGIVLSWIDHPMVRTGIVYEGIRVWVFTSVNSLMAFYLPVLFTHSHNDSRRDISIWPDILFAVFWGLMWCGFHTMKNPDSRSNIWDPYGAFLWVLAGIYAVVRVRRGEMKEYFHLVFAVALLAGTYGILQYSGRDVIWSSLITPYGGRPVSTFGNPNFLSSYLVLVSPMAFAYGLRSKREEAVGYFIVAFVTMLSVLGTLTRSSYVGLFVAYVFMAILLFKRDNMTFVKWLGTAAVLIILLICLFPKTPLSSFQSPLSRFTEIFEAMESGKSYGPWHQRVLIWSSAWDMVQERILFGKGWGAFELFYPFYQGNHLMNHLFAQWRTHANNAHNILMEIWSQTGTIGAGLALWLFVTMLVGAWTIFRRSADGLSRTIVAALLAGFVGMVADNFFGNVSIFFAVPAFLFWWNMGALYHESTGIKLLIRPVTPLWGRTLLILLMVCCLSVVVYFMKRWEQEVYYFKGFKEAKIGRLIESYKSLEKAVAWFGGEVNTNYELGNSYARYAKTLKDQGFMDQAETFYGKALNAYHLALDANPGYDEIYFNTGVTYMQMAQGADDPRKDRQEALRNFEISLLINPLLSNAYGSLGNLYLQTKQLKKAQKLYEQAVAVYPNNKDFWNNLGFTYSQDEQDEKAMKVYKRAISLDPKFGQAWNNLRIVAKKLGIKDPIFEVPDLIQKIDRLVTAKQFVKAKALSLRLVELLPENADAHLGLANIYFYLREKEKSIASMKKALNLRPRFTVARVNLGKIYLFYKQFDQARQQFEKVLKIDPNNRDATSAMASLPH